MAAIPRRPPGTAVTFHSIWDAAKPYLALAILSILVAVVIIAIFDSQGNELKKWWQALLAGYVSDSTLQKFKDGGS